MQEHIATTLGRLGGIGLPDNQSTFDDLDALAAYVGAMPAPVMDGARRAASLPRSSTRRRWCASAWLGVEIAQGVEDAEPIAIAYAGAPELERPAPEAAR